MVQAIWAWLTSACRLLINIHWEGVAASDEASGRRRWPCGVQQSERREGVWIVSVDVKHQLVCDVRCGWKDEWKGVIQRGDAAESCRGCQPSIFRYVKWLLFYRPSACTVAFVSATSRSQLEKIPWISQLSRIIPSQRMCEPGGCAAARSYITLWSVMF